MSLSQTGKRTLVIDADIRKPIIHERLDSDQVPGLAEYLAGDVEIEQVIRRDCVQQGLDLIPAGNPPADVPSILGLKPSVMVDRLSLPSRLLSTETILFGLLKAKSH